MYAFIMDARIVMEMRPENGVRDRVVVGQPFIIDVTIDEVQGSVQAPIINGLDKFNGQRTGMYMSSVNGKSTTRYSYRFRIDAVGEYTIGPAVLNHQKQELISNAVSIKVVKDMATVTSSTKTSSQEEAKVFLRLMVDTESVVVGQKLSCMLRFYYQDSSISLTNLGMPELAGFDVKSVGNLENGVADNNGERFRYAQWRWDMYPTKPGEFIIPAYNIDYEIPNQDNRLLGGLFMFINSRVDRKRVYSNAITVNVAPLPPYNGRVDAIGSFERMTAEIKPGMAKEGEGMVLALEIEGVGNLDAIAIPTITMPEALKCYDSNSAIIMPTNSDEVPKKRFEFIVQGMQSGDWEIPEQLFTYFDIDKKTYITLRTSPLAVSIMPGVNSNKKDSIKTVKEKVEDAPVVTVHDDIDYINSVGPWYPVANRQSLPWWLFYLLFLIPGLYLCSGHIYEKICLLTNNSVSIRKRRAFKNARKKIDQSIGNEGDKNLYLIFIQLFSLYGQQSLHSLKDTDSVLREKGMPEDFMQEWNGFCESIVQAAYAQSGSKDIRSNELCQKAKQWISRLEKIL